MLPDIGATELMVIALVALIFVGPKDLPMMLRKLGQFTSKMRRMANEFRSSFDDMARQTELDDLRREVEEMRRNTTDAISDPIGLDSAFQETIDDIEGSFDAPADTYPDYDQGSPDAPVAAPAKPKSPRKRTAASTSKSAAKPATKKVAATKAPATPRKRPATKIVT